MMLGLFIVVIKLLSFNLRLKHLLFLFEYVQYWYISYFIINKKTKLNYQKETFNLLHETIKL